MVILEWVHQDIAVYLDTVDIQVNQDFLDLVVNQDLAAIQEVAFLDTVVIQDRAHQDIQVILAKLVLKVFQVILDFQE